MTTRVPTKMPRKEKPSSPNLKLYIGVYEGDDEGFEPDVE